MNSTFVSKMAAQIALLLVLGSSFSTAADIPFNHVILDRSGPKDPWAKIIGDIDGDGFLDVIIGGRRGPLVWYACPRWTKAIIAKGGYRTVDGETGDIDGDGDLDVVMGGLLWYENPRPEANPAKKAWKAHKIADHPTHDVELGDLDGDGHIDIVTRDQSEFGHKAGNKIYLWRQDSAEKWAKRVINCPHGEAITLGDIDNDSDPDVVIGGIWFENDGDIINGAWTAHRFARWHPNATVQVADINGDALPDVVLSPSELRGNFYKISWFERPSDPQQGNWTEHIIAEPVECVIHGLVTADMNGDGAIDMVAAEMHQGSDPDEVAIYINQDRGSSWKKQILSSKGSHYIRVGDFGNDGDMDIIGANHGGAYQPIEMWENKSITRPRLSNRGTDLPAPASFAARRGGEPAAAGEKNNPVRRNWPFEHKVLQDFHPLKTGHSGESAIVDINNDGKPDIWFNANNGKNNLYQMAWYKNPSWQLYRNARGNYLGGNWIDIDGDGDMDLVTSKRDHPLMYVWLENAGNPEQRDWPEHVIDKGRINADATHFADLNRDGRKDIIVMTFRQDVYYLPTPVNPKKGPWKIYHVRHSDHARTGGSLGDVDSDGDIDIVWGNGWLQNRGEPTKVPWPDHIIDSNWNHDAQSAVADIDKDGSSDIVLAGEESSDGMAWYKREPATDKWIKHKIAATGYEGVHSLQVADFDRDGDLDVFCAEMHQSGYIKAQEPHKITVFENYDIKTNDWKEHIIATTGSHNARVGDINGDKYPDIVGSNWNNRLQEYPLKAEVWISKIGQK